MQSPSPHWNWNLPHNDFVAIMKKKIRISKLNLLLRIYGMMHKPFAVVVDSATGGMYVVDVDPITDSRVLLKNIYIK